MPIKGITLSGNFRSVQDRPVKHADVTVYQLNGLFQAVVIDQLQTDDKGAYRFKLKYGGGEASVLLVAPGEHPHEPLFSQFISLNDRSKKIEASPPPLDTKRRRRSTLINRTSRASSVLNLSLETDSEGSGAHSDPLTPSELHDFFFNSLFCSPPAPQGDSKRLHIASSELKLAKYFSSDFPEVCLQFRSNPPYKLSQISLHRPGTPWVHIQRQESTFSLAFAQSLNTLLQEGLIDKLIPWGLALPALYTQAFLSAIGKENPLQILLSAHLNERLLTETHIGIQQNHPFMQWRRQLGIDRDECLRHLKKALGAHPFPIADHPHTGIYKSPLLTALRTQVIEPAVSYFFESYRESLGETYWPEIVRLSHSFAALHPLNTEKANGWWEPFALHVETPQNGEMKHLQEWCVNALMIAIAMPFLLRKNIKYFTDPRYSSFTPRMQEAVSAWLNIERQKMLSLPGIYPRLLKNFKKSSEVLLGHGLDVDEL